MISILHVLLIHLRLIGTHGLYAAILSRILYLIAPSMLSSDPPFRPSTRLSPKTVKLAKEYGEYAKDPKFKTLNLSSTLEKLHAWEKKLHKEVKVMMRF